MSVNRYNSSTGTLTTLANGQRMWIGTQTAYDSAEAAGTLPNNCLIAITDDGAGTEQYSTEETSTGKVWIDDKPIYRKVFTFSSVTLSANTWATLSSVDLSTAETLINVTGLSAAGCAFNCHITMKNSSGYLQILSPQTWTVATIIAEYTKTTD